MTPLDGREPAAIARALLGNVAKLIALEVDEDCKDISEWFDRGHSEIELIACIERGCPCELDRSRMRPPQRLSKLFHVPMLPRS